MNMRFYFDYISPNAYLAWSQLHRLLAGRNIEVEPIPVLFSALLEANGQKGPAEIPAKMQWMVRDILRKAKQLNVPLNPPASHPFNPLLALRVSSLALPREQKAALISAIFEAVWVRRVDVSDPTALAEVLNRVGLEGRSLTEQATSTEIKTILREHTTAATRVGVFGVPTMIVGSELFWGLDDFGYLELFLRNEDLLHGEDVSEWSNVHPSASRKNGF
ncbi:MAG: 2-hydroxychromene-2-carboxylate isomerase [Halothiobacillus sp.]|jgi:2-hydroxychromene-2-carboxylate isomerase|nr:2-hydroxychromene-2-carboxylate isomerase [Halothiobacillus sp.]